MIHTISTSDTIHGIAARYLGAASRWREVADANDLRAPYISDDPLEQLGARVAAYPVAAAVGSGQSAIPISGGDSFVLRPGLRVAIWRLTTGGALVIDVHLIVEFAGGLLILGGALNNDYPIGTQAMIYPAPGDVPGRVARPGDTLIIPGEGATSVADRYGRDIALSSDGHVLLSSTGDLVVIAGLDNLRQQLRNRLMCQRGDLTNHPTYGCDAVAYLGQATGGALVTLVRAAVALALAEDPRVARVEGVDVTPSGDVVQVAARVLAQNESLSLVANL